MEEATAVKTRVLIVDDDEQLHEMVAEYLIERDFEVDVEVDGLRGLERACLDHYNLLVLDVRLPTLDGFEVLRRLRAHASDAARMPVIMLTAHGDEVDRIVGLELGADDYLPKPFNPRELLARIRAILRRALPEMHVAGPPASNEGNAPGEPKATADLLSCGDLEMDVDARLVRCAGDTVELSAVEFDVLHVLLCNKGRVVARDELSREALGRRLLPLDRSLDIHVCKLRQKLWPQEDSLKHIRTVRGVGYILVKDGDGS